MVQALSPRGASLHVRGPADAAVAGEAMLRVPRHL